MLFLIGSCTNALMGQWKQIPGLYGGEAVKFVHGEDEIYMAAVGGVYHSSDGARTWSNRSNGLTNTRIHDLVLHDSTLILATGGGVFRSNNRGLTWENKSSGIANLHITSIVVASDVLFVGTWGGGIYKSVNLGESWILVNWGLSTKRIIDIAAINNSVCVLEDDIGVLRLSTSGRLWIGTKGITHHNTALLGLETLGDRFLLRAGDGSIFQSTDYGATWSGLKIAQPVGLNYDLSVAEGNIILSLSGSGTKVILSKDSGSTWEMFDGPPEAKYIFASTMINNIMVIGTDKTIYRSSDSASAWDRSDLGFSGYSAWSMTAHNGDVYLSRYLDRVVVFHKATGWNEIPELTTSDNQQVAAFTLATIGPYVVAGCQDGRIFWTSDRGVSWEERSSQIPKGYWTSCLLAVDTVLYASVDYHGLYRTSDFGMNWTLIGDSERQPVRSSMAIMDSTFYAVVGWYLQRMKLPEAKWGEISSPQMQAAEPTKVMVRNSSRFVGSKSGVFRSDYVDTEWYHMIDPLTRGVVNSMLSAQDLIIISIDDRMIASIDNGGHWIPASSNMPPCPAKAMAVEGDTIYVALDGAGVWMRSVADIRKMFFVQEEPPEQEEETVIDSSEFRIEHTCFPNPAMESITIRLDLDSASHIKLNISDELGRHVAVLVDADLSHGTHEFVLHSRGIAPGFYQYSIESVAGLHARSFIFLR